MDKANHSQRYARISCIKSTQGIDESGKDKAMIYSAISIDLTTIFLKLTRNHVAILWECIAIQCGCN